MKPLPKGAGDILNTAMAILAASVTTFAATNIDDLLLLTMFFARRVPARMIVGGQYLGFAAIIFVSILGLFAALNIPHDWLRVLGLVPLLLGLKELVRLRSHKTAKEGVSPAAHTRLSIALVTFSNGADNLGVYIPFFSVNRGHLLWILITYSFLVALWCILGKWLGRKRKVLETVDRVGHLLVPLVFISLGLYILRT